MSIRLRKGTVITCSENNHRICKTLVSFSKGSTIHAADFEWYIKNPPKPHDLMVTQFCDEPCQGRWIRNNPRNKKLTQVHTAKGWIPK